MRVWAIGVALTGLLFVAPAFAQDSNLPLPQPVTVPALPTGAQVRPFRFTHVVLNMKAGSVWSAPHTGWLCAILPKQVWRGDEGQAERNINIYSVLVHEEMKSAGFVVYGDPDNLFEENVSTNDLQLGAIITYFYTDYCMPNAGFGSDATKGYTVFRIEWQMYSARQKTIVARVETHAGAESKTSLVGGPSVLIRAAFKENVRALIASEPFRSTFIGAPAQADDLVKPTSQTGPR